MIEFYDTEMEGVKVIIPHQFLDDRGLYKKCYDAAAFKEHGIDTVFTEATDIYSKKGALRGLHYQTVESQAKLVHVIAGVIFDAAVDLREGSATFGKCHCELLQEGEHKAVYIPSGFAHGFITLSERSVFSYQCSGRYLPQYCGGILWNDEELCIDWPLKQYGVEKVICTEKDKKWPTLREYKRMVLNGEVKK